MGSAHGPPALYQVARQWANFNPWARAHSTQISAGVVHELRDNNSDRAFGRRRRPPRWLAQPKLAKPGPGNGVPSGRLLSHPAGKTPPAREATRSPRGPPNELGRTHEVRPPSLGLSPGPSPRGASSS